MKLFHHLTVIHGFIANISDFLVLSGAICSVLSYGQGALSGSAANSFSDHDKAKMGQVESGG